MVRQDMQDCILDARGRVSEYFKRSSQRSSSFWSLAKSMAYDEMREGLKMDVIRVHTLFTSPRRSIIRCNAFLLSPIRPSKNTISGTRSRSVQILYACKEFNSSTQVQWRNGITASRL